ncbi:NAD(P)/FAD-dependent oxidoreductase [Azonexus sp. IMCC34842]|uniref:NAD(P)/FAD-dependent oxidoreductase n=1 Tax=Azonexus sp. IMCC34842 TaxID=3420950 RepID=UPI003D0FEDDD
MNRDILIVGGGIFGASIAYALARRGLGERVLLLERQQLAGAATSRAAALVTLVRDKSHFIPLVQETRRAIEAMRADFSEDVGLRQVGALYASSTAGAAELDRLAASCGEFGIVSEKLTPDEAIRHSPWLNPAAFDTAVLFPQEAYVEPYLLSTAYSRSAAHLGVRIRLAADVRRICCANDRVSGVELRSGEVLPAAIVINAAGAWAGLLSAELGVPLPMAPVRSQYWITEPDAIFPRQGPIVLLPEIRAYARPEIGALLFGIRESRPAVADPRLLPADLSGFVFDPSDPDGWENLADGAEQLRRYFPAIDRLGIAHYITGPSNYTPDGNLVVGAVDRIAGLFIAAGCNGAGIAVSGGVGRLIAEQITGQACFVDAAPHRVERHGLFDPFAPEFLNLCAAARSRKTSG